LHKNSKVRN